MDDYRSKPIDREKLEACLARYLAAAALSSYAVPAVRWWVRHS
jgi:hypothetical protein